MKKITRSDMGLYGCNYCRFYAGKWICLLDECFLVTEARQLQRKQAAPPPPPAAKWEVIR